MHRLTLAISLALAACGTDVDPGRADYIQKLHHAMHPSAAPLAPDEIDALVDLSDEDLITKFYEDPQTRDAVFRISLAFLGAPADQLHVDGQWGAQPFNFAPAVAAARAFRDKGDPLAPLFTTKADLSTGVVQPVRDYLLQAFYGSDPLTGTPAQKRAAAAQIVLADLDQFRAFVSAQPEPFDQAAVCDRYFNSNASFILFFVPQILGVPDPVVQGGSPQEQGQPNAFPLDDACFNGSGLTRDDALGRLAGHRQLIQGMMQRLEPIFAMWEANPELAFDKIDFDKIGFYSNVEPGQPFATPHFYPQFWQSAQNSSTNYDRRRGAYVLDRYFCDDLKPVGAALPTTHVQGKHASDPACAACHFKLDPMAGFFRRNGFNGIEFDTQTLQANGGQIIFDDQARLDFTQYEQAWRAPAGAGHDFEVGYIRSTRDASLNSYGSTLDDLDTLLGSAPEVERCFVQRMFEYFNGTDQAVDPGFLDDVVADIHPRGKNRLWKGMARILTGATFRAPDRNSTVCYDLAPDTDTAHRPPCEVASILRTNCTSCHGGANPMAGLDLSTWEKGADGGFGFRHVVDGTKIDRAETFARMKDRVMTSDLTRQMPQAKDMPLRQREQLALWLQAQIDATPAP